jgi:hypothetical protein
VPILDILGDPLAPFSDFPVLNGSTETGLVPCGNDQLARGMAYLTRALNRHAGQSVTYRRGSTAIPLCATFGRKAFRLDDGEGGIRVEWTDKDFLIPRTSLPLVPRRGDRITHNGRTYEVLAPGGEPPFMWCDAYRTMLRIHTKLVSES